MQGPDDQHRAGKVDYQFEQYFFSVHIRDYNFFAAHCKEKTCYHEKGLTKTRFYGKINKIFCYKAVNKKTRDKGEKTNG